MNYGWLDPFGQRYVGSRKGATIGDATLMKLFGFSRSNFGSSRRGEELWLIRASRRVGETSCRGEKRLHVAVKWCSQLDFT